MKTTKVIFLGLFFALIASVSSAQEAAGFTASITESEKPHAVLIQLSGLDGARTAVSISNARGITAYREYLWNEDNYGAHFLMEGMPAGDYLVRVSNRNGRVLRAINLSEKGLALLDAQTVPGSETGRLIARFNPSEKAPQLEVQIANLKRRPFSFYLVNLDGIDAYTEEISGAYAYAKRFDLEGMEDGDYYIYVRAGETAVWQNMTFSNGAVRLTEKFSRGSVAEEAPAIQAVARKE